VQLKTLGQLKNPVATLGIKPVNFVKIKKTFIFTGDNCKRRNEESSGCKCKGRVSREQGDQVLA
jgi:hypothetical protein